MKSEKDGTFLNNLYKRMLLADNGG